MNTRDSVVAAVSASLALLGFALKKSGLGRFDSHHVIQMVTTTVMSGRAPIRIRRNGLTLQLRASDTGVTPWVVLGHYEPWEEHALRDAVQKGDVVYDIGANIGYFTVMLASMVGPEGRVYAFEPDPRNIELLEANVKANNLLNVRILPFALSDKVGQTRLFRSGANFGNNSVVEMNVQDCVDEIAVTTTRIDDLVKNYQARPPNVIKMDVEGHEVKILLGGEEVIRESRPSIVMELNPEFLHRGGSDTTEFLKSLVERDYRIVLETGEHIAGTEAVVAYVAGPSMPKDLDAVGMLAIPVAADSVGPRRSLGNRESRTNPKKLSSS